MSDDDRQIIHDKPDLINHTPLGIIANAVQQGMDADRLDRLVTLHERISKMNALSAYQMAMCECQREMPAVTKDKENQHTRSRYADLATLIHKIKPVYTRHGLSLSFYQMDLDKAGWMRIACDVMHKAGHRETKWLDLPLDGTGSQGGKSSMNPVQGVGSTMSYAERYLACKIFNIAIADTDLDGNQSPDVDMPECPACHSRKNVLRAGDGDGWFCWRKKGGCGHSWNPDNPAPPESEPDMALVDDFTEMLRDADINKINNEIVPALKKVRGAEKKRQAVWRLMVKAADSLGYFWPHKGDCFVKKEAAP